MKFIMPCGQKINKPISHRGRIEHRDVLLRKHNQTDSPAKSGKRKSKPMHRAETRRRRDVLLRLRSMNSPAQSGRQNQNFVALTCEKPIHAHCKSALLVLSGDLSGVARRAETEAGTIHGFPQPSWNVHLSFGLGKMSASLSLCARILLLRHSQLSLTWP